jgi:hypothetical protein
MIFEVMNTIKSQDSDGFGLWSGHKYLGPLIASANIFGEKIE